MSPVIPERQRREVRVGKPPGQKKGGEGGIDRSKLQAWYKKGDHMPKKGKKKRLKRGTQNGFQSQGRGGDCCPLLSSLGL